LDLGAASVGDRAQAVDAAFVVDGAQSIGAMPFDVQAVRPDFLLCSAYKWLLCPYTLGFLYAAPHRQRGRPIEQHGFNRAGAEHAEGATDSFRSKCVLKTLRANNLISAARWMIEKSNSLC
jgi:selenocysteine lyase/cysteine desulfurase